MAKPTTVNQLIKSYPLLSEQMTKPRLSVILRTLSETLSLPGNNGDIVEFGCYSGTTSVFIRRLLDSMNTPGQIIRTFHVYDSFSGLPAKSIKDASVIGTAFQAGELTATKRQLIKNFKQAGLKLPVVHKGWFSDLGETDLPPEIAFAFLDGDFYDSIMASLELVWPRLNFQGLVVVDDYNRDQLPGVTRAINDFFGANNQSPILRHEQNLALIRKNIKK